MFNIDWHFASLHLGLSNVAFDEAAEPALLDEAYPALREPVASYVERYLAAPVPAATRTCTASSPLPMA